MYKQIEIIISNIEDEWQIKTKNDDTIHFVGKSFKACRAWCYLRGANIPIPLACMPAVAALYLQSLKLSRL